MGTPEFAAVHLEALIRAGREVIFAVTQPDRPKGRGKKEQPSPVKVLAESRGIEVLQPEGICQGETEGVFRSKAPDVIVVVAYGLLLPRWLLHLPPLGCVNVHASLLPRYRGAAPINRALINGESETGVTTMLMDAGLDSGDILLQSVIPIGADDTAGTLHDKLASEGASLLLETLSGMDRRELRPEPQNHAEASYAPKLAKSEGLISWNQKANRISFRIRGLDPRPAAYTFVQGKRLGLFGASYRTAPMDRPAGSVLGVTEHGLEVAASDGVVAVLELQLEGKKRLRAADFIRGFPLDSSIILGES